MNRRRFRPGLVAGAVLAALAAAAFSAQDPAVLPLKERSRVFDGWLRQRLDAVLPDIMRREGLDMWVVICSEYKEDPVYLTLVPADSLSARRLSILVFFDRGGAGVERLTVSRYGIGDLYKSSWDPAKSDQWTRLAEIIRERDPKTIGINEAGVFAFGDGLSASHKARLVRALGPGLAARLASAERLAVGWLERRTASELEVYPQIAALAHGIIDEAFSNRVITPGVTSVEDVVWWMRERIAGLKLAAWFQPSISIQREGADERRGPASQVIRRGDLLHCDMGIVYLGLCTDTQRHAYVLRAGETDAPAGLKAALAQGNRLQDILLGEFREARTGNEILAAALARAKGEGLRPSIYTHPLGFHGHAAGPTIGLWDMQGGVPGAGDYPLVPDTCFSIELNVKEAVPEWKGRDVQIALEEDAVFTREGARFINGRQTSLYIIR